MIRSEPSPDRRSLAMYLIWFLLWLAVTLVALALNPSPDGHGTHTQLRLPDCPSVTFFGRPCPGCGLTTSWTHMAHLQWDGAFRAHPFGPILYLGFTASAWAALWAWLRQRFFLYSRGFNWLMGAFVAVYLGFSVWRFFHPPSGYSRTPFAPYVNAGRAQP